MSATLNIVSSNIQGGYGLSETSLIPCFRMQGRSVPVSSFSGTKLKPCQTKIIYSKQSLKHTSFVCKIGSGHQRNNPDFPKHNRRIFSRDRNRYNENRDTSKNNLDESEFVSTKNGPILSISNNPRSNSVIGPGEKEREIVELFRKVQVKLREKGGVKEEEDEKVDSSKEQNKETQSVDSLIKLLRKHSADHGQRKVKVNGGGPNEFSFDHPSKVEKFEKADADERTRVVVEEEPEPEETRKPSFGRPVSSFRRQSPVPKVQYEPIVSKESTHDSNINGSYYEPVPDFESDSEPHLDIAPVLEVERDEEEEEEPEIVLDQEIGFVGEEEEDDNDEKDNEVVDLNAMKLVELRAVAKARGIKGISKLKKSDLIGLLTA